MTEGYVTADMQLKEETEKKNQQHTNSVQTYCLIVQKLMSVRIYFKVYLINAVKRIHTFLKRLLQHGKNVFYKAEDIKYLEYICVSSPHSKYLR